MTQKHHRQIPQGCHIDAFVEGADVGGALAEIDDYHPSGAFELCRKCKAIRYGHARTDDPCRYHNASIRVRQMHGAAFTLRRAVHFTHHLANDFGHGCSLSDNVMDTAIGSYNLVILVEQRRDRSWDRFLPAARVVLKLEGAGSQQLLNTLIARLYSGHCLVNRKSSDLR